MKRKQAALSTAPVAGMSDRRLRRALGQSEWVPITVAVSGARAGDLLAGIPTASSGDVASVLLRVHDGVVHAPPGYAARLEQELGREHMVGAVARHLGLSHAQAALRYDDMPRRADGTGSRPLGSGCQHSVHEGCSCPPEARLVVVSQGVWQGFAEQHGHGAELQEMVSAQRPVCWREILQLMHTPGQLEGKTLILRPALFELVAGPVEMDPEDPKLAGETVLDATVLGGGSGARVVRLDEHYVRLPASGPDFCKEHVCSAVQQAVNGASAGAVQGCVAALSGLSGGALKSLLQKAVRLHARQVALQQSSVPASLVAAVAVALLFADRGSFSPELQLFTRGGTAAFKRLAVIMIEDSWSSSPGTAHKVRCAARH